MTLQEFEKRDDITDRDGDRIRIGDRIRSDRPLQTQQDNFSIDLSDFVTVRVDDQGKVMAGWLSIESYLNRSIEKEKLEK